MEETLTECLVRVREDLNKLKKTRDCFDFLEENCKTKRTIEPFNSILAACQSQNTPETDTLETFLDNFHHLVNDNNDPEVWSDFGYELGIICSKVLSAIERTETFEVLFSKLLAVMSVISENSSDVWKATARQILNVFINKKFTPEYFENILRSYIEILKNIDGFVLYNFSLQNLHLLKTLSMLVHRVGDFEAQFAIMGAVFLHLSNDINLMSDFFAISEEDKALFQSLTFADLDEDCRMYLNALNKPRGRFERKVYSISCHVLYLGGCFVEPLSGRKVIWVDANKESQRVSIKCSGFGSDDQTTIHLTFSEITNVQIESEKTEGNCCVTIQTKNLRYLHCDIENDDICLVADSKSDVTDFVNFLKTMIRKKMGKFSKTETLFIDRTLLNNDGLQVNAISSSARPEVDVILPDIRNLFGKIDEDVIPKTQTCTPLPLSQELKIVLETQDSPSLLESLEIGRTFEDANETVEFLQSKTHKLMGSQEKFFLEPKEEEFCFKFDKENQPPGGQKTYKKKSNRPRDIPPSQRVLRERKQPEATPEDCFQEDKCKKPTLPKLNKKSQKNGTKGRKKQPLRKREYKPLPIQREAEDTKPSLLDPNGYAFQRWLQPTTSERSNFWLKKLSSENKSKTDVFEFSDSDSELVKKPKRTVYTKRRYRRQKYRSKRPGLKPMTEFLKKIKKESPEVRKSSATPPRPDKTNEVPIDRVESPLAPDWDEPIQSNILMRRSTSPETSNEEPPTTQKRNRSDEENSLTRAHFKKKSKRKQTPEMFLPTIRRRLDKVEDKARQQSEEIIATMNRAANHLLNNFQRKEALKIKSYLNVAGDASKGLEGDVEEFRRRGRRVQRAILYFTNGCSVTELCDEMEKRFAKIRSGLKDLHTSVDPQRNVTHFIDRLKSLIESGIDKLIDKEMASKRNQLMRCASMLGTEIEQFSFT